MARSTARGRGNQPHDEEFLDWMEDHGELEVVDPEELGVPFPAKLKWSRVDDDGSPWKIPRPGNRCKGQAYVRDADGDYVLDAKNNRIMRPCYAWALRGTSVCMKHGGGVERVRRAAMERLIGALDATSGELVKIALNLDAEGNQGLGDIEPKVQLQAINSLMDRSGLRGGSDVHIAEDPAYLDVLKDVWREKHAED